MTDRKRENKNEVKAEAKHESKTEIEHETLSESKNETLSYYNQNAAAFCAGTLQADMSHLYDKFLCHIPAGGRILDLGCGSGRDSKIFMDRGYRVTAVDGSEELCKLASAYIGQPVRCMDFEELDDTEEFDGIWACASLLHIEKNRIHSILRKIHTALLPGGVLYVSFKRGSGERLSGQRFFSDYTEDDLKALFPPSDGWQIITIFTTGDVREGREGEQWVNGVVRKTEAGSKP